MYLAGRAIASVAVWRYHAMRDRGGSHETAVEIALIGRAELFLLPMATALLWLGTKTGHATSLRARLAPMSRS